MCQLSPVVSLYQDSLFLISCLFSFGSESGEVFGDIKDQLDKISYAGCFIAWQQNICNSLATTDNIAEKNRTISGPHASLCGFS